MTPPRRFLVLTTRQPSFTPSALAPHYAFLAALREAGRLELAGPFADQSGGAYLLRAADAAEAATIARDDPLNTSGASHLEVREWLAR